MKHKKRKPQNRNLWLVGIGGFSFAFLLSLLAGNLFITNLLRGVIGLVLFLTIYQLLRLWFTGFLAPKTVTAQNPSITPETTRGSQIDFTLPAEVPNAEASDMEPAPSDFQPWIIPTGAKEVDEQQAMKMAQALRALEE